MRHIPLCRAFGALLLHSRFPGLTAGPISCRSFGPDEGTRAVNHKKCGTQNSDFAQIVSAGHKVNVHVLCLSIA